MTESTWYHHWITAKWFRDISGLGRRTRPRWFPSSHLEFTIVSQSSKCGPFCPLPQSYAVERTSRTKFLDLTRSTRSTSRQVTSERTDRTHELEQKPPGSTVNSSKLRMLDPPYLSLSSANWTSLNIFEHPWTSRSLGSRLPEAMLVQITLLSLHCHDHAKALVMPNIAKQPLVASCSST